MIQSQLKYYADLLQAQSYKAFYLAILRVTISCWLLKEVLINWDSMGILYGNTSFVVLKTNQFGKITGLVLAMLRNHYQLFIIGYTTVIILNIFGIGRWFTALTLFVIVDLLQKINMGLLNGGDRMARLILLYLIVADTYQYFVLSKHKNEAGRTKKIQNLFSNLAALSIMIQLCIAYFTSAVAKLNDPLWLNGEAIYYVLQMERFMGTPLNKYIAQCKWIDIVSNYTTLLFELLFPVLVWIKKIRTPLLTIGIIFHFCIYIFLMIYSFQVIFILIYGLFLNNNSLVTFANNITKRLPVHGRWVTGLN